MKFESTKSVGFMRTIYKQMTQSADYTQDVYLIKQIS
jgi:division protein CdvB (Snf7/Vps24/ESCRT-III family)